MRGEARIGIRVERTRDREPSLSQSAHSGPIGPALLSPASECPAPESYHPITKYTESAQVSWDRVVVEVTLYDRLEPFPRLRRRIVHTRSQLLLDFLQLGCHALGDRFALEGEFLILSLPADMREAQEAERFGLAFSSLLPVEFSKSSELDPARLIWMQFQSKVLQPFREMFPEAVCVGLILKPQDDVVRVPYDNHLALRPFLAPDVHPEVKWDGRDES